ncbi:MAG: branched-chain amino acid ABC transporter permease [Hydrogenophaga sp.]|jgi:branched-chain amino acid transport system permease protein|uniref:branched-chain amino acid ABC transporter permease n=2 Tax=Hydrogenophaga sp. TaxID=1904254 RepID=UPI0027291549|nr:branched-chain amino acid ABC transporter permease [Hydrogenophaga sp.]MDO8888026.1 branched-chain amino acid ABC transporter permease [Hydrogenophaga sp.]MDO9135726.1 branched-chain amino acid ABC transporter permease [Hydrogenophaga sp.]MDO9503791.1 branched-chain amino acid ABC transporter permease [Hydrogenophaga sp.]MDP1783190.1 branched-chain amino acid ABC transporter permease [Hydrogenophaga sp.]MDP2072930.1 branched-chain amino acid ABC transporter permease [Hydrogenophaga sp.]
MTNMHNPNTGFNKGRVIVWSLFALALLVAPFVFTSNLAVTMLSQMGIAIIACLSYNILLGQGGMLSFGHAVYTGLGSYVAMHALNAASDGQLPIPVIMLPLVGGLAGLFFAVLFGYVTTKKAGTTFAMITLGVGELVFAMSLMFSDFFGGEAGVSGNRVVGEAVMGITFGPPRQVYFLIAVYTFVCVGLMFAFTRTPLGRILNAVRDNPERVEFIGYNTQKVRYLSFMIAGFFAGIAGGLASLNFEIVTAEVVGAGRSGAYLLFTFLGGATIFFGPIIGGVLMVLASVLLSELTKAWLLYLGLIFLFMVMYAPGGVASLIMMNVRVAAYGLLKRVLGSYALLTLFGVVMFAGAGAMIEMMYHLQLNAGQDTLLRFFGVDLDAKSALSWVGSLVVLAVGFALFEWVRRRFMRQWHDIQVTIEKLIQQREAA